MDGWVVGSTESRRFELPQEVVDETGVDGYVTLRALTDAEALERESRGIEEWYYLDGQEPAVRRTYDLQAMAEYDYAHCILGFRLPVERAGEVVAVEMDGDADGMLETLQAMPPRLAEWIAECIAEVNLRTAEVRRTLEAAKKN